MSVSERDRARQLLEERARKDPLFYYRDKIRENVTDDEGRLWPRLGPTPTQLACWQGSVDYQFRLLTSGNQGAKTTHAMCEVASLARGLDPFRPWAGRERPVRILVIVISQRNADDTWGRRLLRQCEIKGPCADQPLIPSWEIRDIEWAKRKGGAPFKIVLHNESEIYFAWSGSHDMWERVQGSRYDFIFIDEGKSEKELFDECVQRLQVAWSDESKPGGGTLLWTATGTVNCKDFTKFRSRCLDEKQRDYGYFLIDPQENPAVDWRERERMNRHLSKEDYDVRVTGTATKAEAYYIYRRHFDRDRHTTVTPYEPGLYDNIVIAYDPAWGRTASECGILFCGITPDKPDLLRPYRFIAYRGDGVRQHVIDMQRELGGRMALTIMVDPAIQKADPMTGESTLDLFYDLLDEYGVRVANSPELADNNVNFGIHAVMDAFDTNRVQFMNMEDDEMQRAVSQVEMYQSKEETKYFKAQGIKKRDNECPDCLRYLVTADITYVDLGANVARHDYNNIPSQLSRMIPTNARDESDIPSGVKRMIEEIRAVEMDEELQDDDEPLPIVVQR